MLCGQSPLSRCTRSAHDGQVIEVIESIAQRTNLLSLNAAIEAASAGDAGRGFAIVAKEVKDLARQTYDATHDITQKITEMQGNTLSAVTAITDIRHIIENVNEISHSLVQLITELSSTADTIAQNIGEASGSATQISETIASTADTIANVSEGIGTVSQSYAKTIAGVAEINSNAERLTALSTEIKSVVGQFKV